MLWLFSALVADCLYHVRLVLALIGGRASRVIVAIGVAEGANGGFLFGGEALLVELGELSAFNLVLGTLVLDAFQSAAHV